MIVQKSKKGSTFKQNKLKIKRATLIWIVINGFAMFPITFESLRNVYRSSLLIAVIYALNLGGSFLGEIYHFEFKKIFGIVFLMNGTGLLLRVLLEYGEASMLRDLTGLNVIVFLMAIPTGLTLCSYIHKNKNNYGSEHE